MCVTPRVTNDKSLDPCSHRSSGFTRGGRPEAQRAFARCYRLVDAYGIVLVDGYFDCFVLKSDSLPENFSAVRKLSSQSLCTRCLKQNFEPNPGNEMLQVSFFAFAAQS